MLVDGGFKASVGVFFLLALMVFWLALLLRRAILSCDRVVIDEKAKPLVNKIVAPLIALLIELSLTLLVSFFLPFTFMYAEKNALYDLAFFTLPCEAFFLWLCLQGRVTDGME